MPLRRHSSAVEYSLKSPEITIRILSSDEYCLRGLRRIVPRQGTVRQAGVVA